MSADIGQFLEQEVLPRLSVEHVYTHEAHKWQKAGDKWRGGCPWHDSKSGTSFYIDVPTLRWRCPACGIGGGPIQYLHRLRGGVGASPRGKDFIDCIAHYAKLVGLDMPQREQSDEERQAEQRRESRRAILTTVEAVATEALWTSAGDQARAYLNSRGFDDEAVRSLGLGLYTTGRTIREALERGGHSLDEAQAAGVLNPDLQGYVLFPWADEHGRPLTLYGEWPARPVPAGVPKKRALWNPKDAEGREYENTKRSPLYLDRARRAGNEDVVLVEGLTDAALAQVRGDTRVVACVAAELSRLQAQTLARCKVWSVTIALDPDQAGLAGIASCIRSLLAVGVNAYVAPKLPDGLDPDEFILAHGIDAWRAYVGQAAHCFRWKARQMVAANKPDSGWTDTTQDVAIIEAVEFAAAWPVERDDELHRHFWPEIVEATGADLSALAEQYRRERAQKSNGKADAEPTPTAPENAPTLADGWPAPLDDEAYYGLPGEIIATLDPHTEADKGGLLLQLLIGFGNAAGRSAHFRAEEDQHHANEYAVLVGKTAKGRKGSSWGRVRRLMEAAEQEWTANRIASGASSGEGLIWQVRDPIFGREKQKHGKAGATEYVEVQTDPGVSDKRLMVFEPEFASVLKQTDRQGNTLSAILRQSWERGDLRALTKNSPAKATGAHVSMIGHCTSDELRRYLSTTEAANGFANRFIWFCVQRSKVLPEGSRPDPQVMAGLEQRLGEALAFARCVGEMHRDEAARSVWCEVYGDLSEGKPGLSGAMLARGEAHVMRLSCIYALLDRSPIVGRPHLLAALALWEYCERSVRFVFGDSVGDPLADELLRMLQGSPAGMTRTDINNSFGRHQGSERIGRALGVLLSHRLARKEAEKTTGRSVERWFAIPRC